MRDQGVYEQLWKEDLPVIRLLLKQGTEVQKIQLYKHEFEKTGARNKLGYIFNLEIVNGKAVNNTGKTAVAYDLLKVMNENEAIAEWLKNQRIRISIGRSCELNLIKNPS